jgi:hypothetical protein
MRPHPGEPVAGPWRVVPAGQVLALLGHPRVLAVDGRSAGGKTTAAARLAAAVPGATVVHTDDVAWHHSFFDWADLLAEGVLDPVRRGLPVEYRPPAWDERSREGAITVAAGCPLVIVEGVGAGRRELAARFDALVWVQSDAAAAARTRGIERDGPGSDAFWDEWAAEE